MTLFLLFVGSCLGGLCFFLLAIAKQMKPRRRNPEAERIARTLHANCACGRVLEFRRPK